MSVIAWCVDRRSTPRLTSSKRTGIQPQLDALRQHEAQATALRADLGGEEISDADEQLVATLAHLQSEEEANAAEIARLKQLMTDQQQEKLLLAQRMQLTLEQSQRIRQTVEENAKKADARDRLVIELALRYEIAGYTVAALPLSHEVRRYVGMVACDSIETAQKFVDELKTQLQAMRAHVTQLKVCDMVVCIPTAADVLGSRIATAPICGR